MQIKVTKKEAMEIYSQRYLDSQGKVMRYLPLVLFALAIIAGVSTMYLVNEWLGIGVVTVLSSLSLFMGFKAVRTSNKYARGQIKG